MLTVLSLLALAAPPAGDAVAAVVSSSLPTAGGQIRQFAFDGDPATYFASEKGARATDHVTLTFEKPVALKSVAAATGQDAFAGILEVSADGAAFEKLAAFEKGKVDAAGGGKKVLAVRVRPAADGDAPLQIREITLDAEPKVAVFKYPVEFKLDVADAPEMTAWAEKAVAVCVKQYPMICDELASEGYKPPTVIRLAFKSDYKGVAEAGGGRIRAAVKWFKDHPEDGGALVHETAHCVQAYRGRNNPGWLVEGIADYIRFWKFEPGKAGKLNPDRAQYNGSYRTSAAFLAYVVEKYDPKAVTKLNALLRAGKYDADAWKTLTKKSVEELNQEWRSSLVK